MATPDGKVTFEAGGRTRTLQFTINRLCLLEDKLGKTTLDVATELQFNPSMNTVRALFWAGLGESDLTLTDAGDLAFSMGMAAATSVVREAFAAAFPAPEGKEGAANPPVAAAG
jgi:hypothetical protein